MRAQIARYLVRAALALIAVLALVAAANWNETAAFIQEYDAAFKLIGLGIGPVLAILGFFWGLVDKAELKDLTEELGRAKQAAEHEKLMADVARNDAASKLATIRSLKSDLATIADAGKLWKLRENAPFADYRGWKYDPLGAKIVSVALFKGGVGKTHLAANLAAYASECQQKPVLLVDLDYQGSLSTVVLTAADLDPSGSQIDSLFDENADLATLAANRTHLAHSGSNVALNNGRGLARAWITASDYSLSEVESRLLVSRVLVGQSKLDERYRLAHVLLNPVVRREFSLIIIDTPPRMTLGTVNALVASHYIVVPTILDKVSSEAVEPFLKQVSSLKKDLALDIELAAVIGTMTRDRVPNPTEEKYFAIIKETLSAMEGIGSDAIVYGTLPRKKVITDSGDLGYFLKDTAGSLAGQFYNPLFNRLWTRIFPPRESV